MARTTGPGRLIPVAALALLGCSAPPPGTLGVRDGRLQPCPGPDNCVSSDAAGPPHAVAPYLLAGPADSALWDTVVTAVAALPRTRIVTRTADYLHAEARSRVFRFVDDLELHLRPDSGIIAVRSVSRVGQGDLGVNRRRVERLREALRARGVVR